MRNTRRNTLRGLLAGLLGLGAYLLPGKARANRRRDAPVGECPALGPALGPVAGPRYFLLKDTTISFTVDYPTPDNVQVYGNGFFCVWGTCSPDTVSVASARVTIGSNSYGGTKIDGPSPCKWAFYFKD